MNKLYPLVAFAIYALSFGCVSDPTIFEVHVSNPLPSDRISETIEIDLGQLSDILSGHSAEQLIVRDGATDELLATQLIDLDGDDQADQLLFQSNFGGNETKNFHVALLQPGEKRPSSDISTYGRFVPERIDDFAWENDRVAFRTYGPTAQKITESGKPGGTLSSGIDCWLKRVEYPIIDKWYREDLEEGKSYHQDHGEGLDNYHVGPSRGTGGTGLWKNGELLTSKNFERWNILANGPIRTIFELDYGSWDANGTPVNEIKRISIDLGSNLYKCALLLENAQELPNITIGVTLHDKAGKVKADSNKGWFRYWEPHDGSELSTAIVLDPGIIKEFIDHRVEETDLSNILVVCAPDREVVYYAGFAWAKSNQFTLPDGFDHYLADFAERLANPLKIDISE